MITHTDFDTLLGVASACFWQDRLVALWIGGQHARDGWVGRAFPGAAQVGGRHPLAATLQQQLAEYFSGQRREFALPYHLVGSPLQRATWQALSRIPYGETVSYQQLTQLAGGGSPRSAGTAMAQNPLPIILPCHRVVRADGQMGNYSCGDGPSTKAKLLALEQTGSNKW